MNFTKQYIGKCSEIRCFSQAYGAWLDNIRWSLKPATVAKYEYIYSCHLRDALSLVPLNAITEDVIYRLLKLASTNSASIFNSICNVLFQVLNFAGIHNLDKKNLIRKCRLEVDDTTRVEHFNDYPVFDRNEQKRLIDYIHSHPDRYNLAVMICLYTGMRIGEVCALRACDVDLNARIIKVVSTTQRLPQDAVSKYIDVSSPHDLSVPRVINHTKTCLTTTSPKSLSSYRKIPICNALLPYLKGRLKYASRIEPRTLQYHYKNLLQTLCIPYRKFHTTRHTFATNCIAAGMDPKCLSEILGHASVNITLNRYVHPTMENKRLQLDKVNVTLTMLEDA